MPPKKDKTDKTAGPPPPEDLARYNACIARSGLAEVTRKQYQSRLGMLVRAAGEGSKEGKTVDWTLRHCKQAWAGLEARYGARNYRTLRTFVNLALSMLTNHAERCGMSAEDARAAHGCWTRLYAAVTPLALEHYETNEPTARMRAAHVPWKRILEVRDGLIRDRPLAPETLLLSMYTFLPPCRVDLGDVRVYRLDGGNGKKDKDMPPAPDSAAERATPNFVTVRRDGGMSLTLSAFKNRSASFPRSVRELPEPLRRLVAASLEAQPRDWLMVSPRTGEPWTDPGSFGKFMRDALRRLFGRPLTANGIRHAFATALDLNALSPRDKDEVARTMLTSARQLERYRLKGLGEEGKGDCKVTAVLDCGGKKKVKTRGHRDAWGPVVRRLKAKKERQQAS
jgi:hypothetical protein